MTFQEILICCLILMVSVFVALAAFYTIKLYKGVDGELHVFEEDDKDVYRFVLNNDPESLQRKDHVRFVVVHDPPRKKQ